MPQRSGSTASIQVRDACKDWEREPGDWAENMVKSFDQKT